MYKECKHANCRDVIIEHLSSLLYNIYVGNMYVPIIALYKKVKEILQIITSDT